MGYDDTGATVRQIEVDGTLYDIVGYVNPEKPEAGYDFFDLFDSDGFCLNEGDPFFTLPNEDEVRAYLVRMD